MEDTETQWDTALMNTELVLLTPDSVGLKGKTTSKIARTGQVLLKSSTASREIYLSFIERM